MEATRSLTETARRATWPLALSLDRLALWGILAAALAFRLSGIRANFPGVTYGDETFFVRHSLAISWSDLNPHTFVWGTFHFYVLRAVAALADIVSGAFSGHALAFADYYLLARGLALAAGVGTVIVLFAVGRALVGNRAGLLAAALFALSPFAVETAHYATVDSAAGFWVSVALLGMVLWIKGNDRAVVWMGVATGIAIATKYNMAVLLVPIVLIALEKEYRARGVTLPRARRLALFFVLLAGAAALAGVWLLRAPLLALVGSWSNTGELQPVYVGLFDRLLAASGLAIAGAILLVALANRWRPAGWIVRTITGPAFLTPVLIAAGVFILSSPFIVLDFPSFVQGFFFPIAKQVVGGLNSFAPDSITYQVLSENPPRGDHFFYLRALVDDWGPLALGLMLVGLWALARRSVPVAIAWLAMIVVVLLGTAGGNYQATRYIYAIWGVLALLGGMGTDWVLERALRLRAGWNIATATALSLLLLAPLALGAWNRNLTFFMMPDTRQEALVWIEEHVPARTMILREWGTPEIELAPEGYHVDSVPSLFETKTLSEWQASGVSLVVVPDFPPELYLHHPVEFRKMLVEYGTLKRDWKLVASFPLRAGVKGEPVFVYAAPGQ